jgi:hypothetical protein
MESDKRRARRRDNKSGRRKVLREGKDGARHRGRKKIELEKRGIGRTWKGICKRLRRMPRNAINIVKGKRTGGGRVST